MKGKKKAVLLAIILAVIALAAGKLVWDWVGPPPEITYLCYGDWSGWTGSYIYELTMENGVAYVETSYEPGPMSMYYDEDASWTRRREMSQEERETLNRLVFREVRVQDWPKHTGPDFWEITDQDSWELVITCKGGISYNKEGYREYPEGLTKIRQVLNGTYTDGEEGNP